MAEIVYGIITDLLSFAPPGLADMAMGAYQALFEAYASNLEWVVEWALREDLADNLSSHNNNEWVTNALIGGIVSTWTDWLEGFDLDFLLSNGDSSENIGAAMMRARGGQNRRSRIGRNGPSSRRTIGTSVGYDIGTTKMNAIYHGKARGYTHSATNISNKPLIYSGGQTLGSPVDSRTMARAKAFRERHGWTSFKELSRRNVAVAKVEVNGRVGFIERADLKLGDAPTIHSEERIGIAVDRLRQKGYRVRVLELFTERKPCTTQQCRTIIKHDFPGAKVYYYTSRRYKDAAKDLVDAYRGFFS